MFGRNGEPDRLTEHTCGQISQDINHEMVSQLAALEGKVIQEHVGEADYPAHTFMLQE